VIKTFRSKETEQLHARQRVKRFRAFERVTQRKLRLARYSNTSARFWLNAQAAYDLEVAQDELQRTIERDVHPFVGSPQTSKS
jgi:plasmid maintenance system antidote protein VapI